MSIEFNDPQYRQELWQNYIQSYWEPKEEAYRRYRKNSWYEEKLLTRKEFDDNLRREKTLKFPNKKIEGYTIVNEKWRDCWFSYSVNYDIVDSDKIKEFIN